MTPTRLPASSCMTTSVVVTTSTRRKTRMILEETIKKLHDLKLGAMADAVRELLTKPPGHKLAFDEQLGLLVEREWTDRQNKALARRLKQQARTERMPGGRVV